MSLALEHGEQHQPDGQQPEQQPPGVALAAGLDVRLLLLAAARLGGGGRGSRRRGGHQERPSSATTTRRMSSSSTTPDDAVAVDHPAGALVVEHDPGGVAHDLVARQGRGVGRHGAVVGPHHPLQGQHVRLGHLAGEVADVLVGRCADHLVGRADLHDLAVAHDQDAVTELERLAEVVGDEDHRLAHLLVQADDLVLHVATDQRVERGERLVEHQDLGVGRERAGQTDPLLHAAGELVGVVVLVALEADQVDHLLGAVAAVLLALAPHLETEGDVVDHLAVRQQAEVLEDHRDLAAPGVEQGRVGHAGDVLAVELDGARGRLDQPGQQPHQRGLAGAGEPHHHEDLAGRHVEGDVADADDVAGLLLQLLAREVGLVGADDLVGARAEDLPQPLDVERGRAVAVLGRGVPACVGRGHDRTSPVRLLRLSPGG